MSAYISKQDRVKVYSKYNGKCAYCGVELKKGWHVDHITPLVYGGQNQIGNMNPSCAECNNYKCHTNLEDYRAQLGKMLNEKLDYFFKSKTKMKVAMNMGSIKHSLWDGKFYFEKIGAALIALIVGVI